MAKTKSLQLPIDRLLQNPCHSFREGHLDFATAWKGKTRQRRGFGIFRGVCETLKRIFGERLSWRNKEDSRQTEM